MAHIFISYARSDVQAVDQLVVTLKEAEIEVWIDREGIAGGEKWRSQIVDAIKSARAFVIALSPDSVKSDNVRRELAVADKAKKPIVPIVLRRTELPSDLQYTLSELQRIEFAADHAAGVSRLVKALRKIPGTAGSLLQSADSPAALTNMTPRRLLHRSTKRDFERARNDPASLSEMNMSEISEGLRQRGSPGPETPVSKRRSIFLDPSLSSAEKIKAISETFPVDVTQDEMRRAIFDDPSLTFEQKFAGWALVAAAIESQYKK